MVEINKLTRNLKKYKDRTPKPRREFDQFTADLDTTVKRATRLFEDGALTHKRVVFLGDDDLTSVACSLIDPLAQITVLEIDRRIVALLKEAAKELHLRIKVEQLDLIKDLPNSLKHQFDTVFTDPPYAGSGVALFLNRGLELLRKELDSSFYVCHGYSEKSRERGLNIQKIINERGLLIKNINYAFNHYFGAKSVGSKSSLYELNITAKSKPMTLTDKRIYSHD